MDLADFRKEYTTRGLRRKDMAADPFTQFATWFAEAVLVNYHEPNAMTLATVDASGQSSQRIVLLKSFDDQGFVFFTNYGSRKAVEMETNPRVSLLFPWITMERQVIVEGTVTKVSPSETAEYFAIRPRVSQIGAWASHQSEEIPSREFLTGKLGELNARFEGQEIPPPPFWGGYRVSPSRVEFWQGGPARLHDRIVYQRDDVAWSMIRLSP